MSLNLDLSGFKESTGFSPLPPGTYTLIVDECEVKETKNGTGSYINCKFKVLTGEQEGRFIFNMFNIKNQNQQAVEIGLGQLRSFMRCAGADNSKLTDVNDLIGLRCQAIVKTKPDDGYGEKSVISYFRPIEGASTAPAATATGKVPF